jgi:hypothetical protein
VGQVELAGPVAEVLPRSQAERQWLGERPAHERCDLDRIRPVLDLPHARHAQREVVVVDVQAAQLDERHPLVEHRVRLPAEHLDVVAEVDEGLAQVADVDALAAHVGLAPVREERDAQGSVARMHEGTASPAVDRAVKRARSRR